MAITRAQQAKQMLREGGRIGLKGGADAATESFAKSYDKAVGNAPGTTKGRPDRDFNPGTGGGGPTFGDAPATTVDKDTVKKEKAKYEKQFFDKGKVPPLGSRPTDLRTKINQRNLQKRLNYINYVQEQIRNKLNKGLIDYQEEEGPIEGLTDFDTLESYIDKVQSVQDLVDKGFYKSDGAFAKGQKIPDFPATDLPGVLGIAQDIFKGPVTSDKLKQLNEQLSTLEGLKTTEGLESTTFKDLMEEYQPNRFEREYGDPKDDRGPSDPCLGPNPPAYCFIGQRAETPPETPTFTPAFRFMNRGGMVEDAPMGTGIMDLESARQMMFIGGVAKAIGKGLKSVTRAAKKVFKSPFGKAALFAAPFVMGGGGTGILSGLKGKLLGLRGVEEFGGKAGLLKDLGLIKGGFGDFGGLTAGGASTLFGLGTLIASLQKPKEDENFNLDNYYEKEGLRDFIASLGQRNRFLAEGGKAEPVAKKTMPLLDLDGQEMDFRAEGGFVPIGRMEKADDVPARLSKNEFVFTAEAVRNAGDGDVDKGAEVMYNTMKNLEAGGTMSEESQGQDGAKEMFQTAQRLGEVI